VIVALTGLGKVLHEVALRLEAGHQLLRFHELLVGALLASRVDLGQRLLHFLILIRHPAY